VNNNSSKYQNVIAVETRDGFLVTYFRLCTWRSSTAHIAVINMLNFKTNEPSTKRDIFISIFMQNRPAVIFRFHMKFLVRTIFHDNSYWLYKHGLIPELKFHVSINLSCHGKMFPMLIKAWHRNRSTLNFYKFYLSHVISQYETKSSLQR